MEALVSTTTTTTATKVFPSYLLLKISVMMIIDKLGIYNRYYTYLTHRARIWIEFPTRVHARLCFESNVITAGEALTRK